MKALFKTRHGGGTSWSRTTSASWSCPSGTSRSVGPSADLQMQKLEELAHRASLGGYGPHPVLPPASASPSSGADPRLYHPEQGWLSPGRAQDRCRQGQDRPGPPKISSLLPLAGRGGRHYHLQRAREAAHANHYRKLFSIVAAELGIPQATPHWCDTPRSRMKMAGMDEAGLSAAS